MEILRPSLNNPIMGGAPANWTALENKMFEDALALYDGDTPEKWQKVAEMIPGKTVADVIRQYKELVNDVSSIEAGLVPIPGYDCSFGSSCFSVLDWRKRSRPSDHERKKGIPWTEKEHKLFLLGLKKHGKGDWKSISRNFVRTRTPTQVASHAQKYFNRQVSSGKDKRRASIHDITTVNVNENQSHFSPENPKLLSSYHPNMLSHNAYSNSAPCFQWTSHSSNEGFQYDGGKCMGFYL